MWFIKAYLRWERKRVRLVLGARNGVAPVVSVYVKKNKPALYFAVKVAHPPEKVAPAGLRILAVFTPFVDVYYADITQYIPLCPPALYSASASSDSDFLAFFATSVFEQ
jgi:hypothetical protein